MVPFRTEPVDVLLGVGTVPARSAPSVKLHDAVARGSLVAKDSLRLEAFCDQCYQSQPFRRRQPTDMALVNLQSTRVHDGCSFSGEILAPTLQLLAEPHRQEQAW